MSSSDLDIRISQLEQGRERASDRELVNRDWDAVIDALHAAHLFREHYGSSTQFVENVRSVVRVLTTGWRAEAEYKNDRFGGPRTNFADALCKTYFGVTAQEFMKQGE